MKTLSYILGFIFISFLFTPTVVALLDRSVDISIAYNVNEEENSSKNQVALEYTLEELDSNYESIYFLQMLNEDGHYYKESKYKVFIPITSPKKGAISAR